MINYAETLEQIVMIEHKETKDVKYLHPCGAKNQPLQTAYSPHGKTEWKTLEEWKTDYSILKKYIRYE